MNLLKNIFGKKDAPLKTYEDFWNWFVKNEKGFFDAVKTHHSVEEDFFDKLSPKLKELKDGFYYLTGMLDDTTAELVITAEGDVSHIAFVEELVEASPKLTNWKFTALKPALDIKNVRIEMAGNSFSSDNMFFYAEVSTEHPDEIDITIIHTDITEENKQQITHGTHIFLDNFLGEMEFATTVDNITVIGKANAEHELVPIEKLKAYLIWRQKEFIEKYEGTRHNTDDDTYSSLEATLKNGNPLFAIINTDLLHWDSKASHPWIMAIKLTYDGSNNNGLPDNETYAFLGEIEDDILTQLKDEDGYLNVGRETADGNRNIYFACNDFRKPSKVLYNVQKKYVNRIQINYEIYKDKYWQTFERFMK